MSDELTKEMISAIHEAELELRKKGALIAKLFVDGQEIAIGEIVLEVSDKVAVFWPTDASRLDKIPSSPSMLKMTRTGREVTTKGFRRCNSSPLHWYLDLA